MNRYPPILPSERRTWFQRLIASGLPATIEESNSAITQSENTETKPLDPITTQLSSDLPLTTTTWSNNPGLPFQKQDTDQGI